MECKHAYAGDLCDKVNICDEGRHLYCDMRDAPVEGVGLCKGVSLNALFQCIAWAVVEKCLVKLFFGIF